MRVVGSSPLDSIDWRLQLSDRSLTPPNKHFAPFGLLRLNEDMVPLRQRFELSSIPWGLSRATMDRYLFILFLQNFDVAKQMQSLIMKGRSRPHQSTVAGLVHSGPSIPNETNITPLLSMTCELFLSSVFSHSFLISFLFPAQSWS